MNVFIKSGANFDALRYPKFRDKSLRIVLAGFQYHLHTECLEALKANGHEVYSIPNGANLKQQWGYFTNAIRDFRPDFVLSINLIGFDIGGVLSDLLERLELPLAVWWVDSPLAVLLQSQKPLTPWTQQFSWDRGTLLVLRRMGYADSEFLPLATSPKLMTRRKVCDEDRVGFVGASMRAEAVQSLRKLPLEMRAKVYALTHQLGDIKMNPTPIARLMPWLELHRDCPVQVLPCSYWHATGNYRRGLVAGSSCHIDVFGDKHWALYLKARQYQGGVEYGRALAEVYGRYGINLNNTSAQMPTGVNQRVFDVPACGQFILTDHQSDLDEVFEVGEEVVAFTSLAEQDALIQYYRKRPGAREAIARKGYKRVLAEHTYAHRLQKLVQIMRRQFDHTIAPCRVGERVAS